MLLNLESLFICCRKLDLHASAELRPLSLCLPPTLDFFFIALGPSLLFLSQGLNFESPLLEVVASIVRHACFLTNFFYHGKLPVDRRRLHAPLELIHNLFVSLDHQSLFLLLPFKDMQELCIVYLERQSAVIRHFEVRVLNLDVGERNRFSL